MLTAYQAETVAFSGDGELVCYDCVKAELDEVAFAKAEDGLHHTYSPLCRFTVDEYDGERIWEKATQRVDDFVADHPVLADLLLKDPTDEYGHRRDWTWRLVDRVTENLGDAFKETCGNCGAVLS